MNAINIINKKTIESTLEYVNPECVNLDYSNKQLNDKMKKYNSDCTSEYMKHKTLSERNYSNKCAKLACNNSTSFNLKIDKYNHYCSTVCQQQCNKPINKN